MNVRAIGLCFLMNFYNLQSSCDQEYNSLTHEDQISTERETNGSQIQISTRRKINASQTHRPIQIQSNLPEGRFHKFWKHSEIVPHVTGRKVIFCDEFATLASRNVPTQFHQKNGQIISGNIESTAPIASIDYVPTFYSKDTSASKRSWFSKVFCGCYFSDAAINPRKIHPSQS